MWSSIYLKSVNVEVIATYNDFFQTVTIQMCTCNRINRFWEGHVHLYEFIRTNNNYPGICTDKNLFSIASSTIDCCHCVGC